MTTRSKRWLLRATGADLVAATVLIGGLIGSLTLGSRVTEVQRRTDASEFERRVAVREAAIESALSRALDVSASVAGLFDASLEVEEAEFEIFAEALLQRQPEVRSVQWLPRVPSTERPAHLAEARASGHPDYRIRGRGADGREVEIPPQHETWPIRFVCPAVTNEHALGFDQGLGNLRRIALEASIRSRGPVATEPLEVTPGGGTEPDGLLIFHPVYDRTTGGNPQVRGAVVAVLDLRALIDGLNADLAGDGLDAWLLHTSRDGDDLSLRVAGSAGRPTQGEMTARSPIDLPGLRLELLTAPGPGFADERGRTQQWWFWAVGGLLTVLLSLGFKGRGDHARDLSGLATEVGNANRALETEVAERQRAEANVRRLNSELQERVDLGTQEIQVKTTALTETRRQLEEEQAHTAMLAGQRLESLGLLAGGVAHDFNNLLTTILGQASLLGESNLPAQAMESATQIELAAQRAAELVRQLLTYAGRAEPRVETMYVSDVVAEIRRLVDASLNKKARLVMDLADDLPPVEVDGTQLRQVLMNLITNASDALGGEAGTIRVTTHLVEIAHSPAHEGWALGAPAPGSYVAVRVEDDGRGMDEATVERMFEPFYTTKTTGHGLGLAAVLGVVRDVGGTIRVRSRPGQGTTIELLLPAAEPQSGDSTRSWIDEIPDLNGIRVLLVDDEAPVRGLVRAVLSRVGCEVTEAVDGVEAMELFAGDPAIYDLVILDMIMPRMDGPETLVGLRRLRADVPVILSSGYSSAHVQDLPLGAHGMFLSKPYRARDLIAAVRDALGALVHPSA
jgi:signal transduction histidine kinase/ActR/RegA family two-component response regulator